MFGDIMTGEDTGEYIPNFVSNSSFSCNWYVRRQALNLYNEV